MPVEHFTIERSRDPETDIEILRLTGPLTLNTLFEFQPVLRDSAGPKTVVDLSGVPYMDSAGLGALLSFHVSCGRHGRTYSVAGASPRLKTMMEVAHVDTLLNLHGAATEALAALQQG